MRKSMKQERHADLMEKIKKNPFLKDEDLAKDFGVTLREEFLD